VIKLLERLLFGRDVNDDGTGGDDIHRGGSQSGEIVSRGEDKSAPVSQPGIARDSLSVIKHVLRDFAKDDFAVFCFLERPKRDQPVATAHVEEGFAFFEIGVGQHFVAHGE